jgi:Tol biopolymer transport system component
MVERRLERALRQGPPFATGYVPTSLALDEPPAVRGRVGVRQLLLVVAATALLLIALLAGLAAVGRHRDVILPASNGWIAFARGGSGPAGPNGWVERDIYLVREGGGARMIIGSEADHLDQVCPAFSRDGRRLAHGEAEGTVDTGYHDAALVISDIDPAGHASEGLRIPVGGTFPPPCAVWSPDGRRVAFEVPLTSPVDPDRSAAGSAVWVVTVADGHVDVLPDLLATDMGWSPDGAQLAIASGQTELVRGQSLRDGTIHIYDTGSRAVRTLAGPSQVGSVSWSPDGRRLAYQRGMSDGGQMDQEIRVIELDGSGEHLVAGGFGSIYGVGPVWSPSGDRIVYQRMKSAGTEAHDVVLVTPDGGSELVLPDLRLPGDRASVSWRPDSVTWSPDGNELLYTAWVSGRPGRALISRPLDPGSDPVLVQDGVDAGGQNRSWARAPG